MIYDQHFTPENVSAHAFAAGKYEDCTFSELDFNVAMSTAVSSSGDASSNPKPQRANLEGSSLLNCRFDRCDLSNALLSDATLREVTFTACKLLGLNFNDLRTTFTPEITFVQCQLDYSVFAGLDLRRVTFQECRLLEVDFSEANLSEVAFIDCNLSRATFANTDLRGTNFQSATNYEIDPTNNRVKGAKFSYPGVLGLLSCYGIVVS